MNAKQVLATIALAALAHPALGGEIWSGDNRFSLNAALAFNVKLSARNLQPAPPAPGPATGAQVDRFYDNGYVRVDVSDNAGDQTTWWQYDTALGATYDGLPGGAVTLTSSRSPAQGETFRSQDDPQAGLELGYARRLWRCGDADKPWLILGVESAFAVFDLSMTDSSGVTGNAITADTFHLAPGNIILSSSYEGNFLGDPPGPLLGSEPATRNITTGTARLASRLDGQMYAFKVGPTVELPLGPSLLVQLSGGWTVAGVNADYRYQEATLVGAGLPVVTTGSGQFDAWRGGPYLKGSLSLDLGRQWQTQCGVQWQDTGALTDTTGDYETRLDLRSTLLVTFGVGFSF